MKLRRTKQRVPVFWATQYETNPYANNRTRDEPFGACYSAYSLNVPKLRVVDRTFRSPLPEACGTLCRRTPCRRRRWLLAGNVWRLVDSVVIRFYPVWCRRNRHIGHYNDYF